MAGLCVFCLAPVRSITFPGSSYLHPEIAFTRGTCVGKHVRQSLFDIAPDVGSRSAVNVLHGLVEGAVVRSR
jgi:hypothetical protein